MLLEKFQLIDKPYQLPRFAAAFSRIPVIENQNGKAGFLQADGIISSLKAFKVSRNMPILF